MYQREGKTAKAQQGVRMNYVSRNYVKLSELIALDPPSGGLDSAANPLRNAEVVLAVFVNDAASAPPTIFYGMQWLEKLAEGTTAQPWPESTVMVELRSRVGCEIGRLCAMLTALKGKHDYAERKPAARANGKGGIVKVSSAFAQRDDANAISLLVDPIPRAGALREQIADGGPFMTTRLEEKAMFLIVAADDSIACYTLNGVDKELGSAVFAKLLEQRAESWNVKRIIAALQAVTVPGPTLHVIEGGRK